MAALTISMTGRAFAEIAPRGGAASRNSARCVRPWQRRWPRHRRRHCQFLRRHTLVRRAGSGIRSHPSHSAGPLARGALSDQNPASKTPKRFSSSHCCAAFSLPLRNACAGGGWLLGAGVALAGARQASIVGGRPQARTWQEAVFEAVAHQMLQVGIAETVSLDRAHIFMREIDARDTLVVGRQRHRHAEFAIETKMGGACP